MKKIIGTLVLALISSSILAAPQGKSALTKNRKTGEYRVSVTGSPAEHMFKFAEAKNGIDDESVLHDGRVVKKAIIDEWKCSNTYVGKTNLHLVAHKVEGDLLNSQCSSVINP
ncbi:MAG: hypothetical protein HON90_14150 [Halobacteriovoraceae bacterium]|jgi:uncharacterized protein YdeI (BOF family)|nr:hypothetical protein [Halobacteriovoraceae bacterium]